MSRRRPAAGSPAPPTSSASRFPGTEQSPPSALDLERLGRLCSMRVLGAGVDLQLADLGAPEAVPRQHALDGVAQHLRRPAVELGAQRPALEPARIAGVPVVDLVVELLP